MYQRLENVIQVEWKAQELQQQYKKSGPLIKPLIRMFPKDIHLEKGSFTPSNYLIIQGSFDPPTLPHLDLLLKAIDLRLNKSPFESIKVVILLSLSHVDKKLNVLDRSLLGYRVEMLEKLFKNSMFTYPTTIGLSNVARYIDLIKAVQLVFNDIKTISFIMGMDVFKKIFDPSYYKKPLEYLLPKIFKADYFVAGRETVFSEDDFLLFLTEKLPNYLHEKVHFLSLPNHFRLINATQIRKYFSKKQTFKEANVHPTTLEYLKKHNLYQTTPDWQATKIAIQTIIQLTLEAEKTQITAIRILNQLLPIIKSDKILQHKLIKEYQSEEKKEITKRWNQIAK